MKMQSAAAFTGAPSSLPEGMMFADPGYLEYPDGRRTVFIEAAQCRNGRGEIWHAHLKAGADPASAQFGPLASGIHTFCPAGNITFVDGKVWQFSWKELATRVPRRLKDREILRRLSDRHSPPRNS